MGCQEHSLVCTFSRGQILVNEQHGHVQTGREAELAQKAYAIELNDTLYHARGTSGRKVISSRSGSSGPEREKYDLIQVCVTLLFSKDLSSLSQNFPHMKCMPMDSLVFP